MCTVDRLVQEEVVQNCVVFVQNPENGKKKARVGSFGSKSTASSHLLKLGCTMLICYLDAILWWKIQNNFQFSAKSCAARGGGLGLLRTRAVSLAFARAGLTAMFSLFKGVSIWKHSMITSFPEGNRRALGILSANYSAISPDQGTELSILYILY